ncbi:unnamed protein product [Effrenium voratum]|uniref:Uncharacterized protein n=1 Tax=Effrenium voratum TaxID=2562239 RepID=A0AA36ISA3_9DINO|nr:unnamed protein product [Effrenium voratum]
MQVEDAEEEAREALKEVTDVAADADVLAVLLTVFRTDRDSAIRGDDSWENPLGYCKRMCALCDRNFLSGGGQPRADDFPARVVAGVYAECGRTFFVAGETSTARDQLQKALNVYEILKPGHEELPQLAACRASLARVCRKSGQLRRAQDEFLQALQLLAELPDCFDAPELISEYAEVLAEAPPSEAVVSTQLLELMMELVEEKFGDCSEEHIKALQELSGGCLSAGRPALAAPLLLNLTRALREDGAATREIQAAEQQAAEAFEAAACEQMQQNDFEAAANTWSSAIRMREALNAQEEVLAEMRASLAVLQQMAGGSAAASTREPGEPEPTAQSEDSHSHGSASPCPVPDSWDEELPSTQDLRPKPSLTQPAQSLRPGWSRGKDGWD